MDPNNGKLYASVEEATEAGVEHPIRLQGRLDDLERVSKAVGRLREAEEALHEVLPEPQRKQYTSLQREARRKRIKAQRAARKRRR